MPHPTAPATPKTIKGLRLEAGFSTQADLAAAVGVRQGTVSRWENGLMSPAYQGHGEALAEVLTRGANRLITAADVQAAFARTRRLATLTTASDDPGYLNRLILWLFPRPTLRTHPLPLAI